LSDPQEVKEEIPTAEEEDLGKQRDHCDEPDPWYILRSGKENAGTAFEDEEQEKAANEHGKERKGERISLEQDKITCDHRIHRGR